MVELLLPGQEGQRLDGASGRRDHLRDGFRGDVLALTAEIHPDGLLEHGDVTFQEFVMPGYIWLVTPARVPSTLALGSLWVSGIFSDKMKASSTDSSSAERSQAEFEQRQKEQQRLIDEGKLTAEEATRRNF
ncbi:MAG: hypothetical protein AAGH89_02240, partial [Verrucomicrobiota bacterium]